MPPVRIDGIPDLNQVHLARVLRSEPNLCYACQAILPLITRESLDAPDHLPEQAQRQVALSQLRDEVPGMSGEAPTGLE